MSHLGLAQAIERVKYKKPSPIQMAAIPLGLQQRDVIGVAETGSGKTAAFVLPMLVYIMKQPPMNEDNEADGPYAVVRQLRGCCCTAGVSHQRLLDAVDEGTASTRVHLMSLSLHLIAVISERSTNLETLTLITSLQHR